MLHQIATSTGISANGLLLLVAIFECEIAFHSGGISDRSCAISAPPLTLDQRTERRAGLGKKPADVFTPVAVAVMPALCPRDYESQYLQSTEPGLCTNGVDCTEKGTRCDLQTGCRC
jgi:hypothetical protein